MLSGPASIVAASLVVAGVFKVVEPAPTTAMLRSLRLPATRLSARGLGVLEIAAGAAALALGGLAFAGPAALYAAFAVLLAGVVRTGSATSCGCFGTASSPPSVVHVVADAAAAAVALAAVAVDAAGLGAFTGHGIGVFALGVAAVALGTWLFVIVLTVLPDTLDAARRDGDARPAVASFHTTGALTTRVPAPEVRQVHSA